MIYASTVFDDDLVVMTEKERSLRIVAFVCNVERLLGAESGSLMDVMGMFGEGDESSRD